MTEDKGHYRCYIEKKFQADSMELIRQANIIILEYETKGFPLTLRQLYYQFVARGLIENAQANYNRLGNVVSDGRLAGLISWHAIEDRTRNLRGLRTYKNPGEVIDAARSSYRRDLWQNQACRPEVWVEKDALIGIIEPVCNRLRVDYFGCRGYNSQSEQWNAGQRFAGYYRNGQRPIVLHLGDHDPSGIDMTRDNQDRLSMFAGVPVAVIRLALNFKQVEELNPPPNPTKMSDSRAENYVRLYGHESWELDALSPEYIARLIEKNVAQFRDPEKWDEALAAEAEDKNQLDIMLEGLK